MYIGKYYSFAVTYPTPPSGTKCAPDYVYCCSDNPTAPYAKKTCGCKCKASSPKGTPPVVAVGGSGSSGAGAGRGASGGATLRKIATGSGRLGSSIGTKKTGGQYQTIGVGAGVGAGSGSFVRTGVELLPPAVQEALEPVVEGYEKIEDRVEDAGFPAWLLPIGALGAGIFIVWLIKKR